MVLAVMQTVASELLLLLQHEFDLLQPSPSKITGPQPTLADAAAIGAAPICSPGGTTTCSPGGGGGGNGETELHPAHLLTVCQELLLAQTSTMEETHDAVGSLSQLLSELAPHMGHKPALAPLAESLIAFLNNLPEARGEGLMREEEMMLRAITRAKHEAEQAEQALIEEAEMERQYDEPPLTAR